MKKIKLKVNQAKIPVLFNFIKLIKKNLITKKT